MPLDLSPDDLERARRTLALAPLRAERTRLCSFASIYTNDMLRCEMRNDAFGMYQATRAAYQMLDEAARVSREIDAMEMGV